MDDRPERVWEAIRAALDKFGDGDIHAGMGWLTREQEIKIAEAAIEATIVRPGPSSNT